MFCLVCIKPKEFVCLCVCVAQVATAGLSESIGKASRRVSDLRFVLANEYKL